MDYNKRVTQIAKAVCLNGQGLGDMDILEEASNCLEMSMDELYQVIYHETERDFNLFVSRLAMNYQLWAHSHRGA